MYASIDDVVTKLSSAVAPIGVVAARFGRAYTRMTEKHYATWRRTTSHRLFGLIFRYSIWLRNPKSFLYGSAS